MSTLGDLTSVEGMASGFGEPCIVNQRLQSHVTCNRDVCFAVFHVPKAAVLPGPGHSGLLDLGEACVAGDIPEG